MGTASPVRRYGSAPPADDSKSDKSSSVTEVRRQQLGRLDTCQNSPLLYSGRHASWGCI